MLQQIQELNSALMAHSRDEYREYELLLQALHYLFLNSMDSVTGRWRKIYLSLFSVGYQSCE